MDRQALKAESSTYGLFTKESSHHGSAPLRLRRSVSHAEAAAPAPAPAEPGSSSWKNDFATSSKSYGSFHMPDATSLPAGWEECDDGEGNVYYVETATGMTTWDRPAAGHAVHAEKGHQRNGTVMPPGWAKDFTEEGDKYYIGPDGNTSWDKPPGN